MQRFILSSSSSSRASKSFHFCCLVPCHVCSPTLCISVLAVDGGGGDDDDGGAARQGTWSGREFSWEREGIGKLVHRDGEADAVRRRRGSGSGRGGVRASESGTRNFPIAKKRAMAGGRRPRPRKGDRRIDAAIDHFKPMGYTEADIRSTVDQLLEVYGLDGWRFLEEDAYRVVQEALFENEEQQEKPLLLLEQGERQPQEQEEQLQLLHEEETQRKEAALHETRIENDMPIVEVHNEIPSEARLAVDGVAMLIDMLAPEATMPHPAATGTHRTRRPCYGWISESESDSDNEEQSASQQHEVHVPSRGGGLLCTRKRLSRWDVK